MTMMMMILMMMISLVYKNKIYLFAFSYVIVFFSTSDFPNKPRAKY